MLEMLLTKVLSSSCSGSIQIIAMSATMSGLDALGRWLNDAQIFMTNYRCSCRCRSHVPLLQCPCDGVVARMLCVRCRPVPLTEHAVFGDTVYIKNSAAGGSMDYVLIELHAAVACMLRASIALTLSAELAQVRQPRLLSSASCRVKQDSSHQTVCCHS